MSRVPQASKTDLHRAARRQFARGKLTVSEYDSRWQVLERADPPRPTGSSRAVSPQLRRLAARGSGAGFTPWQNGVFGALAALVLASPMIIFELYLLRTPLRTLSLVQVAALARHAFRWVSYGLFYGYFYPRIAGSDPIRKAAFLIVAILPPELLLLLSPRTSAEANLGVAALLRTGVIVYFCIGLGLTWEVRLSYAAGLPWSMVRNLRSFASLGTPLTALLVATTTAVATVVAGPAAAALLHAPVSSTVSPTPAPTSSPAVNRTTGGTAGG